ncbi:dicarboxylate transporter/tellurite-resistance protein TehA [Martelella endophytica]|uniref:dicarboxylate transporter/tellurite-resistance protein TehA n=1 Tax=Martelella endophytica TaxID=1486262 RepID=UPI0009E489C9|nr:dicarboxylate transporter/tellurite-resistance protein TehA [Martelella endophytica]
MPSTVTTTSAPPAIAPGGWFARLAAATPASFFGMVLGLGGLANAWRVAERIFPLPGFISEAIFALGAAVWAALMLLYGTKILTSLTAFRQEASHPIMCCYIGLTGVATMLIAGGLLPYSYAAAAVVYLCGFAMTAIFGVWRTGELWKGERDPAQNTAVLYLPTVAGSFVTATVASALGYPDWGQFAFGSGFFAWLAMESVILHRLLTAPTTAKAIRPTLGIHLAPAPVGAVAYIAVSGGAPDILVHAMIGYGILQLAILARLAGWFRESGPVAGFWGFTFGATSIAVAPLELMAHGDNGAVSVIAIAMFIMANILVGGLTLMTLWLLFSGRLYPNLRPAIPGAGA